MRQTLNRRHATRALIRHEIFGKSSSIWQAFECKCVCRPPGACTVYQSQRQRLVLSVLTPAQLVMVPPGVFTLVEKYLTLYVCVFFAFGDVNFNFTKGVVIKI